MRLTVGRAWATRAVVAALLVGGSAVATVGMAAGAQAQIRPASSSQHVVNEAFRPGIGKMLVTIKTGHALYEIPGGTCTASCQSVWPPLMMNAGKTIPTGASCLATAKQGTGLQVTYNGQRLYTFTGDSGHSVNGNGVAGFVAAKVVPACP